MNSYAIKKFSDVLKNNKRMKDGKKGYKEEMDIPGKLKSVYTHGFISFTLSNVLNGLM